ncbi:putative membrane protein [Leptospira sp. B5-022]|nr:putative membrane protein [Leptospira sp. B5-022]
MQLSIYFRRFNEWLSVHQKKVLIALNIIGAYFLISKIYDIYWLTEDSFISFRVVDNAINGYGLRWNINERVQVYTHPLWLLYLTSIHFFIKNIYVTALVGTALALLAFFWIAYRSFNKIKLIILAALFVNSYSFLEYASSGLETSLNYTFLIYFFAIYIYSFHKVDGAKKSLLLSIAFGLANAGLVLNRMDNVIFIFFPTVIWLLERVRNRKSFPLLFGFILGTSPFFIWSAFSFFYYGYVFPNSYYAKTMVDFQNVRLDWCLNYYRYAADRDVFLLIAQIAAIIAVFLTRSSKKIYIPLLSGFLLQPYYVYSVGADYFGGRWLTSSFLIAVLIIAQLLPKWKRVRNIRVLTAITIIGIMGFNLNYSKIWSKNPFIDPLTGTVIQKYGGTIDERFSLGGFTKISNCLGTGICYQFHPLYGSAKEYAQKNPPYLVAYAVGVFGYAAGPTLHIIDAQGLGDAFLARTPGAAVHPGHYPRHVPDGYPTGDTSKFTPEQKTLYQEVVLLTKADLFDKERLELLKSKLLLKYRTPRL